MDKKQITLITMKVFYCLILATLSGICMAQEQWPRIVKDKGDGQITIYQPQFEKLNGNIATGRTAISIKQTSTDDPVFGAVWFSAELETNRDNRMALLKKVKVSDIKISGVEGDKVTTMKAYLEKEAAGWNLKTSIDDIAAAVEEEQKLMAANLKNDPPNIIYVTQPSTLVLVDGEPKLQMDDKLKMKKVLNTAFLIVQYPKDNLFYLYGGKFWYSATAITGTWKQVSKLPAELQQLDKQIKEQEKKQNPAAGTTAPDKAPMIILATTPTELIQTDGEANFATITGVNLLYASNTDDNIFMDINSRNYFILLSGRWYSSPRLTGPWTYVPSDKLPGDFAHIPKGSEKDIVLASVAGTDEAHDAVMDAQIPQTAKVDRKTATCTVKYDGDPKFEQIEGTSLYLAKNTASTVIKSGNSYYCVENGVWFKASKPLGPWAVSDERPKDVDNIPASSQAYNTKYVYIYESTPQYVYVGYTPAYMGCYVYGPVVVYGTGYYYNPWYGPYYYPRPVTYGFSMHYNPFTGWSMGFHYSTGYFSFHAYTGGHYGYWGPPVYHPPYHPHYHGGMYGGRGPVYVGGDVNININNSNNIYNKRKGVSTNDIKRSGPTNKPASRDIGQQGNPIPNNLVSDKNGNVYQRDAKGDWQQRNNTGWSPADNTTKAGLDKQMQSRERSSNQNINFNKTNRGGNLGGAGRKK
ncbi:hypothetical protein [Flavihumibacter fluvii]|uniref:hypothetical protein n=1 Tax=Flavihumibacter fluvii TaxID=2838157 RepID=UPI001BDE3C65|nr:hypothetical protein [Flavihumibacter fluvii]ULQ52002.1 hypothetical protein KJS93_18075 [Flavihumibacter fluvii]